MTEGLEVSDRRALCRVVTNLQFAKNAASAKCSEMRCACTWKGPNTLAVLEGKPLG